MMALPISLMTGLTNSTTQWDTACSASKLFDSTHEENGEEAECLY